MNSFNLWFICFCIRILTAQSLNLVVKPKNELVKWDSTAVFRCKASSNKAQIRWLMNDRLLDSSDDRFIVSVNKLIVKIGVHDADLQGAMFQCEAKYQAEVILSAPAKLIIATLEDFQPQLDLYVQVIEGNTAFIECNPPKLKSNKKRIAFDSIQLRKCNIPSLACSCSFFCEKHEFRWQPFRIQNLESK